MKTFIWNATEWRYDSQKQSVMLTVTTGGGCDNYHKRCVFRSRITENRRATRVLFNDDVIISVSAVDE
jgi:hypothetical protein